jgi:hypothetical protein
MFVAGNGAKQPHRSNAKPLTQFWQMLTQSVDILLL